MINDKSIKSNTISIQIETNADLTSDTPFFITINGKHLENVKRFYIDLDKDKIMETHQQNNGTVTYIRPITFGVEYEYEMGDENFNIVRKD